eukprot:TRINITY_DN22074_c1_g1_i4.p2 TRINITY_DN22074_c1_g1~~TRINITY_DN22074_c1_g1_i4.p2  ORF type:complete len:220 (+),score=-3.84 TRINITY_DN22074_c1_g1_i4:89-661(+)
MHFFVDHIILQINFQKIIFVILITILIIVCMNKFFLAKPGRFFQGDMFGIQFHACTIVFWFYFLGCNNIQLNPNKNIKLFLKFAIYFSGMSLLIFQNYVKFIKKIQQIKQNQTKNNCLFLSEGANKNQSLQNIVTQCAYMYECVMQLIKAYAQKSTFATRKKVSKRQQLVGMKTIFFYKKFWRSILSLCT